ncbi:unnamed protein product [Schistocephalus solidus]|uniref:Uncharacterized protein n=1 Tax=Schistocephalus solidus TaxID=70667 RepID=A0A3P7F1M1_SCHSO|nr:unnamed protein product [Schistocephalus solidus]
MSISNPDENIVQQMPAPRPRLHPRGLLPRWKAKEGVGQQETVFRTRAQTKEAVIILATETVETQHSLPGSVVHPDAGIEVTKDNKRVLFRHSRQARHLGSVGVDLGGELVSPKRQAEANQAIIDALRQTGQTSKNVVQDGKGNTSVASLCLWPAAPEAGVAGTHLLQPTLLRESGLAECSNLHLVARQFPSD